MPRKKSELVEALNTVSAHIPCDEKGCEDSARCRIEVQGVWTRYCVPHYSAYFTRLAKRHHAPADDIGREPGDDRDWPECNGGVKWKR